MEKSLVECVYEFVNAQKKPVSFKQIWEYVLSETQMTKEEAESKISRFYTNLQLDGRFVNLGNNYWDLRKNHKFDSIHIDMQEIYNEVDEDSDEDKEEMNDSDELKDYQENIGKDTDEDSEPRKDINDLEEN